MTATSKRICRSLLSWLVKAQVVLAVPFIVLVTLLNCAHPFFHMMEGGSVDMAIDYITMLAANLANTIRGK